MIPGNVAIGRHWEPALVDFRAWFPAAPRGGEDHELGIAEVTPEDRALSPIPGWAAFVVARACVSSERVLWRYVGRLHGRRLLRCGTARLERWRVNAPPPDCGHSVCRQSWIDSGSGDCCEGEVQS